MNPRCASSIVTLILAAVSHGALAAQPSPFAKVRAEIRADRSKAHAARRAMDFDTEARLLQRAWVRAVSAQKAGVGQQSLRRTELAIKVEQSRSYRSRGFVDMAAGMLAYVADETQSLDGGAPRSKLRSAELSMRAARMYLEIPYRAGYAYSEKDRYGYFRAAQSFGEAGDKYLKSGSPLKAEKAFSLASKSWKLARQPNMARWAAARAKKASS